MGKSIGDDIAKILLVVLLPKSQTIFFSLQSYIKNNDLFHLASNYLEMPMSLITQI